MRKFMHFAWGLAGLSTAALVTAVTYNLIIFSQMAQEKIPEYEELWKRGWGDFNTISASIGDLTSTTEPIVVDLFPELVDRITEMTNKVDSMSVNMGQMNAAVIHMANTVPPQMGVMNNQMGRFRQDLSPGGMMGKMMQW